MPRSVGARRGAHARLLAAVGVAWLLAYASWHLLHWGPPEQRQAIGALWFWPVGVAAVILALRAARRPDVAPRARRAWGFFGAGLGAFLLGDVCEWVDAALLHTTAQSISAELCYVAFYPLMLAGLFQLSRLQREPVERRRVAGNALLALLGAGAIVWDLILGPAVHVGGGSVSQIAWSAVFPLGDLGMLFGVTTLLQHDIAGVESRAASLLVAGLLFLVTADLIYAHLALQGTYRSGSPVDALWMVSDCLMAAAAYRQVHSTQEPARTPDPRRVSAVGGLMSYTTTGLCLGLLVYNLRDHTVLLGLAAFVTAIGAVSLWQLHSARRAIHGRLQYFRTLIAHMTDTVMVVDRAGRVLFVAPTVGALFPGATTARLPRTLWELQLDAANKNLLAQMLTTAALLPHESVSCDLETNFPGPESRIIHVELTDLGDDPVVAATVVVFRDVTERMRLVEQLKHNAFYDSLTDLPNRALVEDRVTSMLDAPRRDGSSVSVLVVALDSVQIASERLTRAARDEVLRRVGRRLAAVVHGDGTVGRLRDEEFVVAVENRSGPDATTMLGARLFDIVRQPMELDAAPGRELVLDTYVGVASTPEGSAEALLQNAGLALHQARMGHAEHVVVFDEEMQRAADLRTRRDSELRLAAARDEFVLVYQPIVDFRGANLLGVEALLRWRHPSEGLVSPEEFIPLLEANGLIGKVGRWVISQACAQAGEWNRRHARLSVHVNVSAQQLHSPSLVADVSEAVEAAGIKPEDLTLEITESVLINSVDGALEQLVALKALGVDIAIDDFGTGYSSFSYLRQLPVDVLKIDRAFVADLSTSKEAEALVQMLIDLGHELDLTVVAEGIETAGQWDWLRVAGCNLAQGFLISRPVPAAQVGHFHAYGLAHPLMGGLCEPTERGA